MVEVPTLHTHTLRLEPLRERHLDDLWLIYEETRPELLPYMFWAHTQTKPEHALDFIRNTERARDERREQVFIVFADDVPLGSVGLHNLGSIHRSTEMGFWVRTSYAGRGICTAAAARMLRYAFNDLRLHRVFIRHSVENESSRAVIQKLGFRSEGTARDDLWIGDRFASHKTYGMLVTDFLLLRDKLRPLENSSRM